MSELNEHNWKEALISLNERSLIDPDYRNLCLTDPIAAIKEVSDIELPPNANIQFFDSAEKYLYTYLLPPVVPGDGQTDAVMRWALLCTNVPTTYQQS